MNLLEKCVMDSDAGIICVEHCGPRVFCFQLPENCPACRTRLDHSQAALLPFRVPYPFVRASQHPCAVVIKPTNGDFLNDYKVSMDLHIGVTNSKGHVVEFDKGGLHRDRTALWNQCLIVSQMTAEPWIEHWDTTLETLSKEDCWTPQRYHEETFNCYTFVLSFLRCLRDGSLSEAAVSRVKFCEAFVSPRATVACKYIALYRRLKDSGYYVCRNSKSNKSIPTVV
ncbi:MKRN2 opposite strand protein isoform X2 [Nilaparvata lugens]|uniref:MKRN2 opposite strand protein isoform X2 n=1 Tax=Nilaparvata lugens TaxID=108931 RepID=UPI00193D9743|nr:MKRN2 opposite strand protein isoform X2 [Nilaparvata lugens]